MMRTHDHEDHLKQKIVVVRGGALGDGVVSLPAIHSLTMPSTGSARVQLGVIGSPHLQHLATPEVFVDQGSASCSWLFSDAPEGGDSPHSKLLIRADLVLAYIPRGRESALSRNLESLCSGRLLRWDPHPAKKDAHIVDHLLEPLRRAGMMISTTIPSIHVSETERALGNTMLAGRQEGQPLVLLHPGSGGSRKRWPLNSYLALAEQLCADGFSCTIICGPLEIDAASQTRLTSKVPLIRQDSLSDLIALTACADLFVGNDSGPAHVAAAVGTPTIALFGPTNPAIWRPLAPHSQVVTAPGGRLENLEVANVRKIALSILSDQ